MYFHSKTDSNCIMFFLVTCLRRKSPTFFVNLDICGFWVVTFIFFLLDTTPDIHIAHERLILDPLLSLLCVNNVLDVFIAYLWMYRWVHFG